MQSPQVIVLAAGRGKRMQSDLPKVLHPVLFRPMLHYVLDLALSLPPAAVWVVVGHGEETVREHCTSYHQVNFVRQEKQLGTANAVASTAPELSGKSGTVLVLSGDVILLQPETLKTLLQHHQQTQATCTVVTAKVAKPSGYGRILRNSQGEVTGIREEADCDANEKLLNEVNSGIYAFEIADLFPALGRTDTQNKQGEYYLTDVLKFLVAERKKVLAFELKDPTEMEGVNDRLALRQVEKVIQTRTNERLMLSGVTLFEPASTRIDTTSIIAKDVVIEGGCTIVQSRLASGCYVESGTRILHSSIAGHCRLKQGSYIESSQIGEQCSVGPYAHLRPDTKLGSHVKIGNFVEIKKSRIGQGSKASHLSYIGDAEIGSNVNLGCGFITCNFDGGPEKNKTIIEDEVFVGSDSQMVAPVRIGRGSYIASGSTITEDVPPQSLALTRNRQTTKPGYAKKYKTKT